MLHSVKRCLVSKQQHYAAFGYTYVASVGLSNILFRRDVDRFFIDWNGSTIIDVTFYSRAAAEDYIHTVRRLQQ